MLYYLVDLEKYWGAFRLFEYITVRSVVAAFIVGLLCIVLHPLMMKILKDMRQPERDKNLMGNLAKESGRVPTMGGLLILIPVVIATLLAAKLNVYVIAVLLVYMSMSLVGFIDDYKKVHLGNSDGVSERFKWIGLTLSALIGFSVLLFNPLSRIKITEIWIPFFKEPLFANPEFYTISSENYDKSSLSVNPILKLSDWLGSSVVSESSLLIILVLVAIFGLYWLMTVGASNAVNVTDGLDGLAIGCSIPNFIVFGIIAYLAGRSDFASYLSISYVPGVGELSVFCSAMIAGSLYFLWHNTTPATVYMGDVGSLGIGGTLGLIAFAVNQPILLVVSGGIFVIEAASSMWQRFYYKKTHGKRFFLMAPIHHHYQKKDVPNTRIVVRMWILSILFAAVALISLKLR